MYALERGIEAAFELEDSELTSELLPPDRRPARRMLFMEAAEGGAGVLRRMQAEPDGAGQGRRARRWRSATSTRTAPTGAARSRRTGALRVRLLRVPADLRQPARTTG